MFAFIKIVKNYKLRREIFINHKKGNNYGFYES